MMRLPIGDWILTEYDTFVGCFGGAKQKIDWFLDMAEKYSMKVFVDVHGIKDSQNGKASSGHAMQYNWINPNDTHFSHDIQSLWMGTWDSSTSKYLTYNFDNINWSI